MSTCDWCHVSLADKLEYDITTRLCGVKKVFRVGSECCITAGRHAAFANLHGCPPMNFQYAATLANVRKMYAIAHPEMRKCADKTYLQLSKTDQRLVLLRRSSRMRSSPKRYTPS